MKACLFARDRLVLAEEALRLPSVQEVEAWGVGNPEWFPVDRQGRSFPGVAALAEPGWTPPRGVSAVSLRTVLSRLPQPEVAHVLTAAHLARWRRTSRYCGVCGGAAELSARHRAMACPTCRHLAFPRISPAVIVQVTRGARILLGRSRRHPLGSYSVLAGFVDPGENLEDAVCREVREESGVRVRDIRYFGSQPWPFPDSLMVGFTALYDGGRLHSRDAELGGRWVVHRRCPAPRPTPVQHRPGSDRRLRYAQRGGSGAGSHLAAALVHYPETRELPSSPWTSPASGEAPGWQGATKGE